MKQAHLDRPTPEKPGTDHKWATKLDEKNSKQKKKKLKARQ